MLRTVLLTAWVIVCAAVSAYAQPSIPPALLEQAQSGSVRVLVRVNAQPPNARGLGAAADRARTMLRMTAAQDRVRAALDDPSRAHRFSTLPWIAARVTRAELLRLAQNPDVAAITPDVRFKPALAESTSLIHAKPLWDFGFKGNGWSVAILDTGVDASHPFLGGRVVEQACFSTTDPEGHATSLCPGGAAEAHGAGSGLSCPSGVTTCEHGTHVAGIAAGFGSGGSGVAPSANLIAIQVFSRIDDAQACGGPNAPPNTPPCAESYEADLIRALEYLYTQTGPGNANRIAAVNMSLAFNQVFPSACDASFPALADAINNLRDVGIATVVAAGNNGSTQGLSPPACISSAISIGATFDTSDVVAGDSNRSSLLSLMAPGVNITSSVPGGGFETLSGTSMAAPHVAGAWALFKQMRPDAEVDAILGLLQSTAVPIHDSTPNTYRRIQLDQAAIALFGGIPPAPGAPENPRIAIDGLMATLQWDPPASGGPVTEYLVAVGTAQNASDIGVFSAGTSIAMSGALSPGSYFVRVLARNPIGQSPPSEELQFTVQPPPPPSPPLNPTIEQAGDFVTLRWDPPATGAVTEYIVGVGSTSGAADLVVFSTGTARAVSAQVLPGTYFVRVVAIGPTGQSEPSVETSFTVVPPSPPGPPSGLTFDVNGTTVALTWQAPATGTPISYIVEAVGTLGPVAIDMGSPNPAAKFMDVPPDTYHVRVRARGPGGVGEPTEEVVIVVQPEGH